MIKDSKGFIQSINYSELRDLSSSWDTLKNEIPNFPEVAKEYEQVLDKIVFELNKKNIPPNTPLNIGVLSQIAGELPEKVAFSIIYLDIWQYLPKSSRITNLEEVNKVINHWHYQKPRFKNIVIDPRIVDAVSRVTNIKTRIQKAIQLSGGKTDRVELNIAEEEAMYIIKNINKQHPRVNVNKAIDGFFKEAERYKKLRLLKKRSESKTKEINEMESKLSEIYENNQFLSDKLEALSDKLNAEQKKPNSERNEELINELTEKIKTISDNINKLITEASNIDKAVKKSYVDIDIIQQNIKLISSS